MNRIIVDIRPVGIAPHLRMIADVKDHEDLLPHSVEIDELTYQELIAYAVSDPQHVAIAPAWFIEAEAQAADYEDLKATEAGAL